nr:unnamed protein product [Callosobruchus analis]
MYFYSKSRYFSVAKALSRNKFESFHRFFLLNDNSVIDKSDKIYKIRSLIDYLNKVSQECISPLGKNVSVDEAMEPCYGRHHMKQFIKGKPIRFGFKFWCLCTFNGYLVKFDVYTGAGDKVEGKSFGSSVTEKLCIDFLEQGSTIFLDNYFTSIPLLETVSANRLYCVGTVRSDRVEKAPLKDLKKENRGSHHTIHDSVCNITFTRCQDSGQVTVTSNVGQTKGFCKNWSKKDKSVIQIDQPSIVHLYNKGMGGVDRFD